MSSYIENLFSLKGQIAVVSGGTGVLCGAMAEGLAGAGAEVYLLGRSAEKAAARIAQIESQGGSASFLPLEATNRDSIESVKNTIQS
jgi:NAD(P)-dependent dehydrogenase (short-subunit alcohol dehydrogenase family)